ncbi:MAG TPA: hypothetical protein DDE71_05450 [Tenacibaculum sp.]|nr:hypothetical protein [Tenacibaculum sp.]
MKLFSNLWLILLFFSNLSYSFNAYGQSKYEKSKTIKKEFLVNKNATLSINNKYGNLNINTWNKNKIEINIKIIVKGGNLSQVEKKLKSINIAFKNNTTLVEAKTNISNSGFSWSWSNRDDISFRINYFVRMPASNNADFNNTYGNIELGKIDGKTNINCEYGSIAIEELNNRDNIISLEYCKNSKIDFMKSGNISVDYSKIKIKNTEDVKVSSDYSNVVIANSNNLRFTSDYGSITAGNANTIYGNSDYTTIRIKNLNRHLDIDTDYASVEVENINKGFEHVTIEGSYAGIRLGVADDSNFQFKINTSYASFKYPENHVKMFKSIKKSFSKHYEGVFGVSNNNSQINIHSSYGRVSLKINN